MRFSRIAAIAAAALIALSPVVCMAAKDGGRDGTVLVDAHLLAEPQAYADKMQKLKQGSTVQVYYYSRGYYYVGYAGEYGYVEETVVRVKPVVEQFKGKGEVNAENVNLRSKGDVSSPIVTVLDKKTKVDILEKVGNWYKVDAGGKQGYIHSDYLDIFEVEKAECVIELKMGMSGSVVQTLQESLKEKGYYKGRCAGVYGARTREAVRKFQKDSGLRDSGVADYETQRLLFSK